MIWHVLILSCRLPKSIIAFFLWPLLLIPSCHLPRSIIVFFNSQLPPSQIKPDHMLWPLLVIPSCHLHRSNLIICPDLYFYFPVATSDADPDLWIRICIIKVGSWSVRRDTNPDLGHTENVQKHAVAKNFNYIFKLDLFLHFYNFLLIFMIFFFFLLLL